MTTLKGQYIRRADLARRYRTSLRQIDRWAAEGHLPKPVRLGPRLVAWPLEQIDAWEQARAQASGGQT